MRFTNVLATASALVLAAGCASSDHHAADRAIENNIRAEMMRYGDLGANEDRIRVHSHDGVVTLRGHVRTEKDRDMLDSMVRNTTGVIEVQDQLAVSYGEDGKFATYPSAAPVYVTPPPVVTVPPADVPPEPMLVPGYSNLKVQASTQADEPAASRVAAQLKAEAIPQDRLQNVTVTVTAGNVALQGSVDTQQQRQAIIAAVQEVGGIRAIYDQLEVH